MDERPIAKKNVVLIALFHYDHFALRLLFAYLREHGVPVHFIGFKRMKHKLTRTLKNDFMEMNDYHTPVTEAEISLLLDELERLDPALVGVSLQSSHFGTAKRITQAIKSRSDVPVVWGGAHPTIDPESCIPHADAVCVGEGFETLLELTRRVSERKPYDDVRNLWVRANGRVVRNEPRPMIEDLDRLPFASYDGENKIYIGDGRLQPHRNVDYFGYGLTDTPLKTIHQTMTAFGCPMDCSFCINSITHEKVRRRSVENVITELEEARRDNPSLKMVFFWDDIFQIHKKWCLEFAEVYKKRVGVPFFLYSHPAFVDEEVSAALRKAGWSVTVMGIQSGSERIRKEAYSRNETNAQVLSAARRLDRLREIRRPVPVFRIYYDYVKDNPLEEEKELKESLDLILKLPKNFTFQAFNLSFFPKYTLTNDYLERGLIAPADTEGAIETSASNWITTYDKRKEYSGVVRMHEYYYLLFSLAQFKTVPNSLIRKMERRRLFYRHLGFLYLICRIVRFFDLHFRPSNYVWLWAILKMVTIKSKIRHLTLIRHR